MAKSPELNRREALAHLAVGTSALAVTAACGSSQASPAPDTVADAAGDTPNNEDTPAPADVPTDAAATVDTPLTVDDFPDTTCSIAPRMTAGPYYFSVDQLRRDISEGKPGARLRLGFRVMDENCEPIPDALVDIWHCDALGYYAGFAHADPDEGVPAEIIADEDETFMRGVQPTSADGIAEFVTIYPGFYRIRTVHVHLKVHLNDNELVTTQTFFPDPVSDRIYLGEPYNQRDPRDVYNVNEGVSPADIMNVVGLADGYRATITLQVRRS